MEAPGVESSRGFVIFCVTLRDEGRSRAIIGDCALGFFPTLLSREHHHADSDDYFYRCLPSRTEGAGGGSEVEGGWLARLIRLRKSRQQKEFALRARPILEMGRNAVKQNPAARLVKAWWRMRNYRDHPQQDVTTVTGDSSAPLRHLPSVIGHHHPKPQPRCAYQPRSCALRQ